MDPMPAATSANSAVDTFRKCCSNRCAGSKRPCAKHSTTMHFWTEYRSLLRDYVGRPVAAVRSAQPHPCGGGARIVIKREDCNHTGAHKINNTVGQALLARRMGKTRLIAETGAGRSTAWPPLAVGALFGLPVEVYMGAVDVKRQALNVYLMRLLGAQVHEVTSGSQTLKDATNEPSGIGRPRLNRRSYVIGSVVGAHPYPLLVPRVRARDRRRSSSAGARTLSAIAEYVVACVGGGSNAMGTFAAFLDDRDVRLCGVEAAGLGLEVAGGHAASLLGGTVGVLHGARTYLLQNSEGQVSATHSISAGMDYPGVGPEHAHLRASGNDVRQRRRRTRSRGVRGARPPRRDRAGARKRARDRARAPARRRLARAGDRLGHMLRPRR